MALNTLRAAVFDLGNVVIEWDPRFLYRKLFAGDDDAMERFLADVCTLAWNDHQDRGRPFAEGVALLIEQHPDQADLIGAFRQRWPETLGDVIESTVEIVGELRGRGVPVYALSNWSAETFPLACAQLPIRDWFDGIVISGEEGVTKPDPRIFDIVCERFGLAPSTTLFVDDNQRNVDAALTYGFEAVLFVDPERLRADLRERGLL